MRPGTTLLLTLVILVVLRLAENARQYEKLNQNLEARFRRHDSEEQRPTSGRRWTTSRNSPYQKIVSSYERVPEEGAEDKAKTRRKQWRSSAQSHDQITSETSSGGAEGDGPEREGEEEDQKSQTVRRRSTTSQPREDAHDSEVENSTPGNKKRRRTTTAKTTTLAPQTMSDSLYKHFRPLDQNVPEDDIIPFLDFGRKLSPIAPTPSSANSIDNKSAVTRHRSRTHLDEREGNSSDEELLQEDMDVTVVKKAIERNSVPRAKLRVKEQGISDYYRKRAPAQVRTTENLISTSDSSTASSIPGSKTVLKKINRLHVHLQPLKNPELLALRSSPDVELANISKHVEVIQEKRRHPIRSHHRSAALREDNHQSPLTAESSVVRTVIKDVSTVTNAEAETSSFIESSTPDTHDAPTSSTKGAVNLSNVEDSQPAATNPPLDNPMVIVPKKTEENDKVLSTAVVTSVSVGEPSRVKQQSSNETISSTSNTNQSSEMPVPIPIPLSLPESINRTLPLPPVLSYISGNNSKHYIPNNATTDTIKNSSETTKQPNRTTERTGTSLRPRDFYKPKPIPPGANIPHLPRNISLLNANGTLRTQPTHTTTTTISYEIPTNGNLTVISSESIATTSTTKFEVSSSVAIKPTEPPSRISTIVSTSEPPSPTQHSIQRHVDVSSKKPVSVSITDTEITSGQIVPITSTAPPTRAAGIVSTYRENKNTAAQTNPTKELSTTETINSRMSDSTTEFDISVVESESVPTSKHLPTVNNTSSNTPVEETEDHGLFPIYFTTLMPSTVPVVDTRPETEEAMVQEQKNSSSPRPPGQGRTGADWGRVGAVDKEVVVVEPETLGLGAYVLAALGVIPILIGALLGTRFILAHSRKKVLDESEYSSEYNRSPLSSNAPPLPTKLPRIPTHLSWNEPEKSPVPPTTTVLGPSPGGTPSAARWEFPREKLRLQTLLGQGNFGQVWKAEADDISGHEGLTRLVAVKTVKESANTREREDLLRELGIMQELGSHPNVVTLLGCCTEKEPIYLIMEYVMYGKMLSFLRDHRTRAHYYNFSDATEALTSRDLTVFGYCVARGLDYLANKSIIHRDLAARNVLVDHNKLCKIADFGMSRNVRDTGQIYEQRQSKGALPIRWMAPESLHFSLFTHKTDVWSFGILMWEIVTLGSTPYARWGAREVMRRVMDGYRLERPTHCRPELFRVITQCWHSEPSKRPSFAELKAELAQLLSDSEHHGSYVDLDSYADEMRRDTLHRHH